MIPDHIFVLNLAYSNYLTIDRMHLEVLIQAEMNPNFFDSISSLIQAMLNLENRSKTTLADFLKFLEHVIITLFEVLLVLVILDFLLFKVEHAALFPILASLLVLHDVDYLKSFI